VGRILQKRKVLTFKPGMIERLGDGKLIIIISITVSGINDRIRFYS